MNTRKNFKGTIVTVTTLDINRGVRQGTNPVEIATRRATKKRGAYVYSDLLEIDYPNGEIVKYTLPKRALTLSNRFNSGIDGLKLKPLTFTLGRQVAA